MTVTRSYIFAVFVLQIANAPQIVYLLYMQYNKYICMYVCCFLKFSNFIYDSFTID